MDNPNLDVRCPKKRLLNLIAHSLTIWHNQLTHWGQMRHMCDSKLTIIGLDNGLSPGRCQAIIWTNAVILLIRASGTNFSEILSEIHAFSFKKMSSVKWQPFCKSLSVLVVMTAHKDICLLRFVLARIQGQNLCWLMATFQFKWGNTWFITA